MPPDAEPALEGVDFVAIHPFSRDVALDLVARASRRLPVPCRLLASPGPEVPRLEHRDQADADALLSRLEAMAAGSDRVLIGLVAEDIGNPIFSFFFGRARLGGRAGLVSTARLTPSFYGLPPDSAVMTHRALVEILHELGHVAGLPHCDDFACLMHVTQDVEGLDARGTEWCPDCQTRLPESLRSR